MILERSSECVLQDEFIESLKVAGFEGSHRLSIAAGSLVANAVVVYEYGQALDKARYMALAFDPSSIFNNATMPFYASFMGEVTTANVEYTGLVLGMPPPPTPPPSPPSPLMPPRVPDMYPPSTPVSLPLPPPAETARTASNTPPPPGLGAEPDEGAAESGIVLDYSTIAGGVVAALAVAGLAYWWRRRRAVKQEQENKRTSARGTRGGKAGGATGPREEMEMPEVDVPSVGENGRDTTSLMTIDVQEAINAGSADQLDFTSGYVAAAELSRVVVGSALESFAVLSSVASLAAEINRMVQNVRANSRKCKRLAERCLALQSSLARLGQQLKAGKLEQISVEEAESLHGMLLRVLEEEVVVVEVEDMPGPLWAMERARGLIKAWTNDGSHFFGKDMASLSEDISRVAGSQQRLEQQLAQQHMGIGEFLRELERNGVTASMLQDAMGRVEDKVDNISVQISRIEGAQINIQEEMAKNLELLMKIESEKSSLGRKSGISKRNTMMEKMPAMTIPYNAITIRQEVGHGGFGIVHKAIWEGNTVAYKELSIDNVTKRILKQLYSEAYVMNLLRHPNICGFFGIVLDKPHYGLVMNFYNGGSLDEILQDDDIDLPSQVYIPMARSMASAMLHLHSSKPLVLHGDLKSRNVLLAKPYDPNSGEIPVKSDSSTMASTVGTTQSGRGGGTLNWTPPELMNGGAHSKASDVYTFGMVLYELVARQYPFLGMQDVVVMNSITQGRRPDIPNDCPSDFAQLIQDCWKQNPTQRPAFDEIKRRLDQMGAERYEEVIELKPSSFERTSPT
eukprot:gene1383-1986_t